MVIYWKEKKYRYTVVSECKISTRYDCSWNSYFRLNFLPSQRSLCFLGKDQHVFHTSVHSTFPLMGILAVSLFVSLTCCLEVFFSIYPSKKVMPNALLESYCYINFRITQIKPLSFLLFKQMSVSALLKRKCPTQLLLFCQDFFFFSIIYRY